MKKICLRIAWALVISACSSGASPGGGARGQGGNAGAATSGAAGSGGSGGGAGGQGGGAGAATGGASGAGGSTTGTAGAAGSAGGGAGAAGQDAGTGGAGPTDAAPPSDGGANGDGNGGDSAGPGAALNGFLFNVPCMTAPQNGDCQGAPADLAKTVTIKFGGDPSVTYDVMLHLCGPVEGRPYTGCTNNQATYFCTDGTAATDGYNPTYPIYEMKVSAPAHSYYVNNKDLKDDIFKIDYSASVKIQGGASLTFSTTSVGTDMFTPLLKGHNFTCPGVPNITQPYAGQFFYITTESVTPSP